MTDEQKKIEPDDSAEPTKEKIRELAELRVATYGPLIFEDNEAVPAPNIGAILIHLGAFLGAIGQFLQEQAPAQTAPRTPKAKRFSAKVDLWRCIGNLKDTLIKDKNLKVTKKIAIKKLLDEAQDDLLKCNDVDLAKALSKLGQSFNLLPIHPDFPLPFCMGPYLVVLNYGDLIVEKVKWERNPDKNNLVFFDPTDKKIKVLTKTGTTVVAKVRKGREVDAKKVAKELNDLFMKCDYPSIELTRKMVDLL